MKTNYSRRNFIGAAAVTTAAALVPGISSGSGSQQGMAPVKLNKNPIRLGLMTYMIGASWDMDTLIKNLQEAQIEHVELRTTHKHGVEVSLNKQQRNDVKKRFIDEGLAISLASGFSYHSDDPVELRKNIEGTKEYLQLAADIGAEGIRVFPNALPPEGDANRQKTLERIAKSASECADTGRDLGVQVRLEEHGRGTSNIPVIRQILDIADNPALYIIWNCSDSDYTGEGLPKGYEGMNLRQQFNLVKDRIGCVHLRELSTPYPWRELFALMSQSKYKGYCDIEVSPASCEGVRYLKNYRALFLALQNAI